MKKLFSILCLIGLIFPSVSLGSSANLYDYFNGHLPSIQERAKIAAVAGIQDYSGTYAQNVRLLAYLENFSNQRELGSNIPVSAGTFYLSQALTTSDTTIYLTKITDIRGNTINFSATKIYFTAEPDNSNNTEIIVCPSSGFSSTTKSFSGCTRGLDFSSSSEATVTANKKQHPSGAKIAITNVGQFYNNFVDIDSNQSIGGIKDFTYLPTSTTTYPTANNQLVTKGYADALSLPTSYWGLNGTNVYRNGGNVGIGTTSPLDLLSINSATNYGMSIYSSTTAGNALAQLYNYSDGGRLYLQSTSTLLNVNVSALTKSWINPVNGASGILVIGASAAHNNAALTIKGTSTKQILSVLDSSGNELMNVASNSVNFLSTTTFSGATTTFSGDVVGAGFIHSQVYTASSTWTKPTGVTRIKVRLVGAGGGGGGNSSTGCAGGGGGGGYSERIIDVSATTSVAVVVGTGGAIAGTGGTSSFGNYLQATGGAGGGAVNTGAGSAAGGAGGVGSGGDINSTGQGGGAGMVTTGPVAVGGIGGSSMFGGGANGTAGTSAGVAGSVYGGGGSGSASLSGAASGSTGANGLVIVEW